ncbi:MAG: DsbC family protein [Burkholderiales bacterium]|nr:DsbC family protein [Burkholderiales bacterium]
MRKILLSWFLFLVILFTSNADSITDKIKLNLNTSLPELKIDQINPLPSVPGIYEIIAGHYVFYVDSSGRYAFLGNMVDLTTKQSLTKIRVEQLSVVDWNKLPLNIALQQVIGKGERKIVIFTDPDCPFCHRLEEDIIPKLNNVTVYYFLFPLEIHANAKNNAKKILCSETPDKTLMAWMRNYVTLPVHTECRAAANLAAMIEVGKNIVGVQAVPTIVLQNGKVLSGVVPSDYLNQMIDEASPVAKINDNRIESTNSHSL